MSHRLRQALGRRGLQAAAGALVAGGALAGVGAAGAAQNPTVLGTDGLVFQPSDITVQTGDTVTWKFDGATQPHNAQNDAEAPSTGGDLDRWKDFNTAPTFDFNKPGSFKFLKPGTYYYLCVVHSSQAMKGVIRVEGDPIEETPTPTPTETATPTPTPTPTPTVSPSGNPPVDDHTTTPAPAVDASADRAAPAISAVRLKGARRTAKVTFRLSESATVTLRFSKRGSSKVLRTVRLQARAGTRTVKVHSALLKRGRYTVELQARDALGNRSPALRSSLRITRK
jgi:plastocyanin